jgi:hypothetical protein
MLHTLADSPARGGGSVVALTWRGLTSYVLDAQMINGACGP